MMADPEQQEYIYGIDGVAVPRSVFMLPKMKRIVHVISFFLR